VAVVSAFTFALRALLRDKTTKRDVQIEVASRYGYAWIWALNLGRLAGTLAMFGLTVASFPERAGSGAGVQVEHSWIRIAQSGIYVSPRPTCLIYPRMLMRP
jgi:hypothetical protein